MAEENGSPQNGKARLDERRMCVTIHEARQNDAALAVQLGDLFSVPLDPRVANDLSLPADGDNFPSTAQNRRSIDQPNLVQYRSAPRSRLAPQRQQLADVSQQQVMGWDLFLFSFQLLSLSTIALGASFYS